MISLRQQLYESLLDDEEDLIQNDTAVFLNSPEFKSHYTSKYGADIQNNMLIYRGKREEIETDGTPISDYLDNIDTIKIENGNFIYKNEKTVSPQTLCKNIIATNTSFLMTDGANDINITADRTYFGSDKPIKFNNVNFNFTDFNIDKSSSDLSINVEMGLPEFRNITINTNSAKLELDDNGLGQKKTKIAKWIEKFMDLTYTFEVETRRGIKESKSDLKSLAKILNTYSEKFNTDKIFKLKSNSIKISDIFPGFPKEFKTITILGWIMQIEFSHPDTLQIYTPATRELITNSISSNILSDGWIMRIIKY